MKIPEILLSTVLMAACCAGQVIWGATFEVGPGKHYQTIGAVPWTTLKPGDTVLIHYRPDPYREKWVICRQGTATAPIVVRGVPNSGGTLPVIDGDGAQTAPGLRYWNEDRGIIKVGGANRPSDTMPRYITIENLDVHGALSWSTFTGADGNVHHYLANAASIYVEKGENIVIRHCTLHDSGDGLFIGTTKSNPTKDILVEANYIYGNGNVGSAYQHNSYTEALGITFQFNHYGPLRPGADGNNLKDRSAGLVVRYNWIEGGNRELDLVDANNSRLLEADPRYRKSYVYGNVIMEPTNDGNQEILHYGGDSGSTSDYRKGTLYFYNNTVISSRTDRTTLFNLSTNDEHCISRNNIFYTTSSGHHLALLARTGSLEFSHNWVKAGWTRSFYFFFGNVTDDHTSIQGASPMFIDEKRGDYRLADGSPCIDTGEPVEPPVLREYVKHQSSKSRPVDGKIDIGAFEH